MTKSIETILNGGEAIWSKHDSYITDARARLKRLQLIESVLEQSKFENTYVSEFPTRSISLVISAGETPLMSPKEYEIKAKQMMSG